MPDVQAWRNDTVPMHLTTIVWDRGKWSGVAGRYSREHGWHFAGLSPVRLRQRWRCVVRELISLCWSEPREVVAQKAARDAIR